MVRSELQQTVITIELSHLLKRKYFQNLYFSPKPHLWFFSRKNEINGPLVPPEEFGCFCRILRLERGAVCFLSIQNPVYGPGFLQI